MLLRDETQMAMNQVETLCFASADHYANAASRTDDAELARMFAGLMEERRTLAAELAVHIRAMDDLPQQPDPDMEAVGEVLSGIKAFLSGDARRTLIDEGLRFEEQLAQAVNTALRHDLPFGTQALLRRIFSHAESTKETLAATRA